MEIHQRVAVFGALLLALAAGAAEGQGGVIKVRRAASDACAGASDLTSTVTHWWDLDEASGTRADNTARAADFAETGTISNSTDRKEGSASADGAGSASNYLLDTGGTVNADFCRVASPADATVGLWFKADASGAQVIFDCDNSDFRIALLDGPGKIRCRMNNSTNCDSDSNYSTGTWTHVLCSWNAVDDVLEQWIDGVKQSCSGSATFMTGGAAGNDISLYGPTAMSTSFFDGHVDELFAHIGTASDITDEIANIVACGLAGDGLP